jgi:hypothetical protein
MRARSLINPKLKEDAMGGVSSPGATLNNTPGMGSAQPATSATTGDTSGDSNTGSGDSWDASIGKTHIQEKLEPGVVRVFDTKDMKGYKYDVPRSELEYIGRDIAVKDSYGEIYLVNRVKTEDGKIGYVWSENQKFNETVNEDEVPPATGSGFNKRIRSKEFKGMKEWVNDWKKTFENAEFYTHEKENGRKISGFLFDVYPEGWQDEPNEINSYNGKPNKEPVELFLIPSFKKGKFKVVDLEKGEILSKSMRIETESDIQNLGLMVGGWSGPTVFESNLNPYKRKIVREYIK